MTPLKVHAQVAGIGSAGGRSMVTLTEISETVETVRIEIFTDEPSEYIGKGRVFEVTINEVPTKGAA